MWQDLPHVDPFDEDNDIDWGDYPESYCEPDFDEFDDFDNWE